MPGFLLGCDGRRFESEVDAIGLSDLPPIGFLIAMAVFFSHVVPNIRFGDCVLETR